VVGSLSRPAARDIFSAAVSSAIVGSGGEDDMAECKHGLKTGCAYCHAGTTPAPTKAREKRRTAASRLSEKMNDRMTALNRRLKQLRGE
jgi:hypothetical protein